MSFETHSGEGFVQLTLNRPPMNALDIGAVTALSDWFQAYNVDAPLILTGSGRAFCAGVDTKAFTEYSAKQRDELFVAITRMTTALCSIRSPVVAAINGHALGGGLVLALCADYRLVADGEHRFGLTEAKAGVPFPAGPVEIIRSEIPNGLLRRLTLSSRIVDADLLIQHGVFDESLPCDHLPEQAQMRAIALFEQPAFLEVKAQIRGPLVEPLHAIT